MTKNHFPVISRHVKRRPSLWQRGVILLLVLGMLALFSLLTATYLVFTSQSRQAAYATVQRDSRAVDGPTLLDQATVAILAGSAGPSSSIWGHDILSDKYGFDAITGRLKNVNEFFIDPDNGQTVGRPDFTAANRMVRIQTNLAPENTPVARIRDGVDVDDALAGRLLTMMEGPLQGKTFRIMRSFADRRAVPPADPHRHLDRILVLDMGPHLDARISHEGQTHSLLWWLQGGRMPRLFYGSGNSTDLPGTNGLGLSFLINGKERNGYGYGWGAGGSGRWNLNETVNLGTGLNVPASLLPHYAIEPGRTQLPPGDPDEPFDVPDFRDMYLGHFPTESTTRLGITAPSFVRPDLINYITAYYGQSLLEDLDPPELQNVLRMLMRSTMRPLPIYNAPEYGGGDRFRLFTGGGEGHPAFSRPIDFNAPDPQYVFELAGALASGPWDVDNNGDGINDSVFIHAGLPQQTMPDGTVVQPMVAYRIEDLSGRVDINAAGSLATLRAPALAYDIATRTATNVASVYARAAVAGPIANPAMEQVVQGGGFGYGPADIDLRGLSAPGTALDVASLHWANVVRERYGDIAAGLPGLNVSGVDEIKGQLRRPNLPIRHGYDGAYRSWQGIPMDVWGRARVAVDPTGAPLISSAASNVFLTTDANPDGNEVVNDPYEMAIDEHGTGDREYTLAEFEPIIRRFDWDQMQLPQRLVWRLANIVDAGIGRERLYRTITPLASSDDWLPAQPTGELSNRPRYQVPSHPMSRLASALDTLLPTGLTEAQRQQAISDFIPLEIRRGMKLDLNRWFGNGLDDNGNNVIDDPAEFGFTDPGNVQPIYSGSSWQTNVRRFSLEANDRDGRQRLARDLYCLMMALLYDPASNQLHDFIDERPPTVLVEDYTAWKVAQWAVNVIDFRDTDNIMTRFVYDSRPFDGWDLTNVATTRVVYGMEAPELLLTESLSWHDRRVRDTPEGGSSYQASETWGAMPDDDLDQTRIPQGTTFLELYAVHSPAPSRAPNPGNPADLNPTAEAKPPNTYALVNNHQALNLAAEAPDGNPIYRIAISEIHFGGQTAGGATPPTESPLTRIQDAVSRRTAWFQTQQPYRTAVPPGDQLPPSQRPHMDVFNFADNLEVDRIVWMSSRDPSTIAAALPADSNPRNIYWNRFTATEYNDAGIGPAPLLRGGQYAVIGPRPQSFVGARTAPDVGNIFDYHSKQRIELLPNRVNLFDFQGTANNANEPTVNPRYIANRPDRDGPDGPERIRPIVGIMAAANTPAGWTNATIPNIGFNISEPTPAANYYPPPDQETVPDLEDTYATPYDTPLDKSVNRPLGNPLNTHGQRTGTRNNFRTAFLQRLADPTRNYDPGINPYITVDWIPLDLTVFNGETPETIQQDMEGASRHIDGDDPNPYNDPTVADPDPMVGVGIDGLPIRFGSRYKSGLAVGAGGFGGQPRNLIYSYDTMHLGNAPAGGNTSNRILAEPVNFQHLVHVVQDINMGGVFNQHSTTLGYLNHCFGQRWEKQDAGQANMVDWLGVPSQAAFPWLPWFNRPFSSPYELLMVPASAPGRLGVEFILPGNNQLGNVTNPYVPADPVSRLGHYGTLWNFFSHDEGTGGGPRTAANFHRILNWVRTPQPFDALEEMLPPNLIPSFHTQWLPPLPTPASPQDYVNRYANEAFRPPFNWVGPLTRRGKINLNTIVDRNVYRALMLPRSLNPGEFDTGVFWQRFTDSRRGYAMGVFTPLPGQLPINLDARYPTQFVRPFQPGETARLAPRLHENGAGPATRMRLTEKDVTLYRESLTNNRPVFERAPDPSLPATYSNRHPFFRFNEISRLANLTTDNTNVFAVWVTVGLFELDPLTLNVSQEYGSDQGLNKRFRAFYIIDRSVPVAYQPGRENNVRDTIRFSRILN